MSRLPLRCVLSVGLAAAALVAAPIARSAEATEAAETTVQNAAHNKRLVTDAFNRWAAGGSDFFNEMLAPDVVWTIAGSSPSAGTYRGREPFIARAVLPFVSRLRTPVRPSATRIWADGEHVIIHWSGNAVALDGKPYHNDYVWIFRMRDDRAVEVHAFLDLVPYEDVLRRIPGKEAA
ncbi:nuclear transport factor 2 family protein [Stenotrophomonas sp. PUT21]|uniref:nuclear transport factor 2 family protein n=1 Tax=Stenotrophomonas TaxID=40323 RepID=UPI003B7F4BE7